MPTPEAKARETIDALLGASGWRVQSREHLNLGAAGAVAVRGFPLKTGFTDYLLFVDRRPIGVVEAQGVKANAIFFDRKPASEKPWTEKLWIYDLRTNTHFTLKQNTLTRADLDEFVACFHTENRHERTASWSEENPDGRWRGFSRDELMARDKVNLDIFWLRDESLEDAAGLADPDVLAAEIVEDLEAALEQFREIAGD